MIENEALARALALLPIVVAFLWIVTQRILTHDARLNLHVNMGSRTETRQGTAVHRRQLKSHHIRRFIGLANDANIDCCRVHRYAPIVGCWALVARGYPLAADLYESCRTQSSENPQA